MLQRLGVFSLTLLVCLLLAVSSLFAQDEAREAPAGEIDETFETVDETDSWITVQYIGSAPGMDEYRWGDEDFGWTHTFDPECKDIYDMMLSIRAWDVDYSGGERNAIYADGVFVGYLRGGDRTWQTTNFDIDPEMLMDGHLNVWVDIDETHSQHWWAVTIDWSRLRTHWDWVPLVADFIASPTEVIGPGMVCFTNMSTCADRWLWDFGDGHTSTLQHPCHVYHSEQKYYSVTLTAFGPGGEEMSVKENMIQVNKQVMANFKATTLVGPAAGFLNDCEGSANKFKWEFGDGTVEEYSGDIRKAVNPEHRYDGTVKAEYDVSLTAWGNGGWDNVTIPNLIYVDPDYTFYPMTYLEGGKTYTGEGWECLVDHDAVQGVGAVRGDEAWATFELADSCEIHYIRMLPDCYRHREFMTTVVDKFQVWVSMDGMSFEMALEANSVAKHGDWEVFMLDDPMNAKFVKLVLVSARGEQNENLWPPKYIEMVEMQVFGEEYKVAIALDKNRAGTAEMLPTDFALAQNFPNPFNPTTSIQYTLPEKSNVQLTIYNLKGQRIRTLIHGPVDAGAHNLKWDACDQNGMPVAAGIYIYQLHAKGETRAITFTRKMTFMK